MKALDAALEEVPATEPLSPNVDATTLKDRSDGRCEVELGSALSVESVPRLACDASLVRVDENEQGEVLNVGRKTRTISPALRALFGQRDGSSRESPTYVSAETPGGNA